MGILIQLKKRILLSFTEICCKMKTNDNGEEAVIGKVTITSQYVSRI